MWQKKKNNANSSFLLKKKYIYIYRSAVPAFPTTVLLRDSYQWNGPEGILEISWRKKNDDEGENDETTTVLLPAQLTNENEIVQNLIVTTKAYQAREAVQSIVHRLRPESSSKIIILCNGALAVREEISQTVPANVPIILATTTHGAYQEMATTEKPATVGNQNGNDEKRRRRQQQQQQSTLVHAGIGATFIESSLSSSSSSSSPVEIATATENSLLRVVDVWNQAGLNCQTPLLSSTEMNRLLWKKLATNCVINPLTAIFQCSNGELLIEPSFPQLQHDILREVATVCRCVEQSENDDDDVVAVADDDDGQDDDNNGNDMNEEQLRLSWHYKYN